MVQSKLQEEKTKVTVDKMIKGHNAVKPVAHDLGKI